MDPGTALAVDAAIERTKLVLQEYRLIEWARAMGLGSPKHDASTRSNQHAAAVVLSQLEQLLSSAEALKKRYKLELVSMQDEVDELVPAETTVTPGNSTSSIISNIVSLETRQAILDRSSKVSTANRFPKRLWWAAVDKKRYAELVRDVTSLVDGLWSLLDVSHRLQTSRAVNQTLQLVIQTSKDIEGLQDLQKSLHNSATDADMNNTLAASAGLKARHISLTSCDKHARHVEPTDDGNSRVAPTRNPLVLDHSELTGIDMLSSTIGSALYQEAIVLIEEKRVQSNMKMKLKPRVEALVLLLSQPPTSSFQTFPCLGYTEEQGGFRLVFQFPSSIEKPRSLLSALSRSNGPLPDAGTRLGLAVQVCQALLSFHTAGWLHKDVRSENILLVSPRSTQSTDHLGRPYLCGFSFARQGSPTEISEQPSTNPLRDIYRHAKALGEPCESFERYMDAYSLGCILIEIAEWTPLRKIVKKRIDTSGSIDVKLSDIAVLSQWMHRRYITEGVAAFRLGTAFMKMLSLCIPAGDEKPDLADFYSALEGMTACNI
ncbi:prion-inhibition and propagation-domain-containing protein [Fusarium venenatum]|uniref:prion-inhibition and propagation-domain-containing protein n=1 Tax=Fusarium venenatum TaxID=56646 RepID=UPI001E0B46E6|nr:prion-inhibition and propagation-domain-containing protein [Fusarium venenatum]